MVFLRPDYLHFSFTSKLFLKTGTWLFHCFLTWDEHDHKINQSVNLCNLISMVIITFQLALQVCRKRSIVLTDHQTTLFHPLNYHALSYKYEALKINQTKSENKMSKKLFATGWMYMNRQSNCNAYNGSWLLRRWEHRNDAYVHSSTINNNNDTNDNDNNIIYSCLILIYI